MTQPIINPYEAVAHAAPVSPSSEPLVFDGAIEVADYQEMLPRDQEWWLIVVLGVLLGICILMFGRLSVLFVMSNGQPLVAVGVFGFWTLMMAALWFLKLRISSVDRANRMLKRYPDLLGCANGDFSDSGLVFRDGVHTYWFGPQHLKHAAILRSGIRMSVDGSVYRYLALSSRFFNFYHLEQAVQLKQRWAFLEVSQALDETPNFRDLWYRISAVPNNAVSFKGNVTIEKPMRTAALRNRAVSELLSYLSLPAMAVIFRERLETWILLAGMVLMNYGLVTNVRLWWDYYNGKQEQSWYQFGWISDQELATCNNSSGVRMPLSQIASKTECNDRLVLTWKKGNPTTFRDI